MTRGIALAAGGWMALWCAHAQAQTTGDSRPRSEANGAATRPSQPVPSPHDAKTEGHMVEVTGEPYLLVPGHYVYPAPYAPNYWSPHLRRVPDYGLQRRGARFHDPYRSGRREYIQPGYRPSGYPPPYGYAPAPYWADLEAAYEQGRQDADREYLWFIAADRAGRLLNQYSRQFDEALISFRNGRYDRAAIGLLGAAEKNHASAAARLHAGHALFALGKYDDAAVLLARAFELAPSLPFKDYDIRDEYGDKADFEQHLANLRVAVERDPNSKGAVTTLGYILFYTEGPSASYPFLARAARLDPNSYFIPKLLNLARLTAGSPSFPVQNSAASEPQASPAPEAPGAAPAGQRPARPRAKPSPSAASGPTRVARADIHD